MMMVNTHVTAHAHSIRKVVCGHVSSDYQLGPSTLDTMRWFVVDDL